MVVGWAGWDEMGWDGDGMGDEATQIGRVLICVLSYMHTY